MLPQSFSGSGAAGLPGDWSSPARFVRLAFLKQYAVPGAEEGEGVARLFRLPGGKKWRAVYLPAVMPYLLSACRVSVGMALKAGVAGEIIGLPRWSFGEQLYLSKLYLNTADLFAWSFVIIVLSMVLEKLLVRFAERMQRKWGDGR